MVYRVNEIVATVQGEGCNTGIPMVLVRLQGCDCRCAFCDTPHAMDPEGGREMTAEDIVEEVTRYQGPEWVLLTGGEPTMQDLGSLCQALSTAGYQIALETNGARTISYRGFDWICVSPKAARIHEDASMYADELKFIVRTSKDIDRVETFLAEHSQHRLEGYTTICLQPESRDPEATRLCYEACIANGWRLSIQVHKLIEVR